MNAMRWPDNRALVEAMQEGERRGATYFRPFFLALFDAALVVPRATAPSSEEKLFFPFVTQHEGQNTLLAFTDEEAFKRTFPQERPLAVIPCRQMCQLALRDGVPQIALNRNGPTGFLLRGLEIGAIAEGQIPIGENQVEAVVETQVQIGRLRDELTPRTKEALRAICIRERVQEMWWFGVAIAGQVPHHALSVAPDSPELRRRIGPLIESVWREWQTPDAPPHIGLFDLFGLDQIRPSADQGERIFPQVN